MAKAETLANVIDDISRKDLAMAKERISGLLSGNKNDEGLREILGRIHLELNQTINAGRYLYLVDDDSYEVQAAIKAFADSRDNDPSRILRDLRIEGTIDDWESTCAKERLQLLFDECIKKYGSIPELTRKRRRSREEKWTILSVSCMILALFIIISIFVGIYQMIRWIFF